jgi:hypothetical protein
MKIIYHHPIGHTDVALWDDQIRVDEAYTATPAIVEQDNLQHVDVVEIKITYNGKVFWFEVGEKGILFKKTFDSEANEIAELTNKLNTVYLENVMAVRDHYIKAYEDYYIGRMRFEYGEAGV